MEVIDRFDGEYRFLSNFYPSIIFDSEGTEWLSVEQAYQAAKTLDEKEKLEIWLAKTPGQAKRLGREVTMRKDWELIKLAVMYRLLMQKFRNPILRAKLMATGNATLIEGNNWGDTYWGQVDGKGFNWLGKLLMAVRMDLRDEEQHALENTKTTKA